MTAFFAIPLYYGRAEDSLVWSSLLALDLAHQPLWARGAGLPKVRDGAAQIFLDTPEADVLVFADSDVTFTPEDAAAVVSRARETRGVAGAAFASSSPAAQWNVFPLGTWELDGEITESYRTGEPGAPAVPVSGLGCGLMAIHRDALVEIAEANPHLVITGDPTRTVSWFRVGLYASSTGNVELSEDLSFCRRARLAGCAVDLVQAAAIGHRNIPRQPARIGVTMRARCLWSPFG